MHLGDLRDIKGSSSTDYTSLTVSVNSNTSGKAGELAVLPDEGGGGGGRGEIMGEN